MNRLLKARKTMFLAGLVSIQCLLPSFANAQYVFVARHVLGRIHQITQQPSVNSESTETTSTQRVTQVVNVVLDAPADRVYVIAANAIKANQDVSVVSNDAHSRTIVIKQNDRLATLSVSPLNNKVSQLTIVGTANVGENPETSKIVDAAMRLCSDLGKTCHVD